MQKEDMKNIFAPEKVNVNSSSPKFKWKVKYK